MAFTQEELEAERKSLTSWSGRKRLELKEGQNYIRILPPPPNRKFPWIKIQKCYQVGPKKAVVVPLAQFGKACPIQKEIDRLRALGDPVSLQEADAIKPRNRAILMVIDRSAEQEGPQIWDINHQVLRDIIAVMSDPQYGDITHPETGVDIVVTYTPKEKTGRGFPDWQIMPRRNSSRLGTPAQIEEWTSKDWFTEYQLDVPDSYEFIERCLRGDVEFSRTDNPSTAEAPVVNAPLPPKTQKDPLVTFPPGVGPDTKFWAVPPGQSSTVQTTAAVIADWVKSGFSTVMVMSYDQSSGWKTAKEFGFSLVEARVVVPPPAPSPTPAVPASVGTSERELMDQLHRAAREAIESGAASASLNELREKLFGST